MEAVTRYSFGSRVLLLAALGAVCMAVVQAIMPFSRSLLRAFDGPEDWSTPLLFASSLAVAAILCVIALYALSAARRVRRLPFLRAVLLVVGVVLVWRGLPLPAQIAGALGYGPAVETWSWGGLVSSAGTLLIGLGYLVGVALSWRTLGKSRARSVQPAGRQA